MIRLTKKVRHYASLALIGFLGVVFLGLLFFFAVTRNLPDANLLTDRQILQSTKIYDRTGEKLLYEIHGEEKRTAIPFEEIPDYVKQATIAIEDEAFYEHAAVDIWGIIRAVWVNLKHGRISQGGSTITQQLAKKAFLSDERTITRKAKELILAIQLEKKYTKDEILGLYLNQVPYGGNAYGIEAAAQTFFGKSAKEVTLAEAATLASLPNAPSYYSPWGSHVEELLARKDFVLEKMFQLGYIDEEERDRAKGQELEFEPQATTIIAPHFVIAVQDYLNNRYGEDFVRTAGLRVITTLDASFQETAERVVREGAERNTELYQGKNAALVAENPTTGEILAMVGSKDYFDIENDGNFNVATQGLRQPGSALKPFVYLTAFQAGLTPDTVVFDLPTEFAANNPDCPLIVNFAAPENKECYHPENFDGRFRGPTSLREGLAQSINIPAIKTLYIAGIDSVLKNITKFGITTLTERSRYGLSLVLGGGEVTLAELVGAYSVLANDGERVPPTIVLEVTQSDGRGGERILERFTPEPERVVDAQPVRLINDILATPENRAPLFESSLNLTIFPGYDVALKTGTTNDYRDAWSLGYSPNLVVGVWAGNNDNTPMQRRGGSILAAVPIWSAFMKEALASTTQSFFPPAEPVRVDKPMLDGNYIFNNEIHSILYYVDRRDVAGVPPVQPQNDPQFENWEEPVRAWVQTNANLISQVIQNRVVGSDINLNLIEPKSGNFISNNQVRLTFQVNSRNPISRVDVFFNNLLIDTQIPPSQTTLLYSKQLTVPGAELQNVLSIKVSDAAAGSKTEEVVLYR